MRRTDEIGPGNGRRETEFECHEERGKEKHKTRMSRQHNGTLLITKVPALMIVGFAKLISVATKKRSIQ